MGGLFGIVSKEDCVNNLFHGTDYHFHLGTMRGGLATYKEDGPTHVIHDISNSQFRSKLEPDLKNLRKSRSGIGVISDIDSQPLTIESHLGKYAIATVGVIKNIDKLKKEAFRRRSAHFTDLEEGGISQTEMAATLINQEGSFEEGIAYAQEAIKGSCSMLLLTEKGIYAARDKLGRTPLTIGKKENAYAAASESCAFINNGYDSIERFLGPGEIILLDAEGVEQKKKPNKDMQVCSFLWVYYGFPASEYENINTEEVRYSCGNALAKSDEKDIKTGKLKIDMIAGIPDSGTAHGIGYSHETGIPFKRPFTKYTPTWPRSFMPQDQKIRNLVANMKLIPIKSMVKDKSILFCEDSIVRGTQLGETIKMLKKYGANEIHMRPACPPLVYGCDFLNFSRSKKINELAGIRAMMELEGLDKRKDVPAEIVRQYSDENSEKYHQMVDWIRDDLSLDSLKYQKLDDLVKAIGLPKEKLCTHCWDGSSYF
ncbi:amidophosphoribosyltransferase [Candidatus Woesearchaeota archaeon]|nr:amidophosphoribosyltransferase [Candidatus Woesearchaeota archaeon]